MANHLPKIEPRPQPTPPVQKHPDIVGVAWFRAPDGWRVSRIRSNDPAILDGTATEPNLKGLSFERFLAMAHRLWESE